MPDSINVTITGHLCIVYIVLIFLSLFLMYEGWNFNSGNYLFTTDTK